MLASLRADVLCSFAHQLSWYEHQAKTLHGTNALGTVTDEDAAVMEEILSLCDETTKFFYLPATAARRIRIGNAIVQRVSYATLETQIAILWETLQDEIKERSFFFMPAKDGLHYSAELNLLGAAVAARFPDSTADIDEAGKCLAFGRYTATVFHLMRVMEAGVQEFGNILGVPATNDKVWQVILDGVDKAIRAIPKGDSRQVQYAELSTLLFAVKLAWRNEVMHPKATYTEEEAESILMAAKAFMGKLVAAI